MVAKKIKVVLAGVGNAASALVQALYLTSKDTPGVWHETIGPYRASDIEIVGAIDIAENKVGKDLAEAIFEEPNKFAKLADIPSTGVTVMMGHLLDELRPELSKIIKPANEKPIDIAAFLEEKNADVLVLLLPVGMDKSTYFYAREAIKAGCAVLNATPSAIASNSEFALEFEKAGVPVVGDDLQSQIGGTILHRELLHFLNSRGVRVTAGYQLDVSGDTETVATLDWRAKQRKREIKSKIIRSELPYEVDIITGTTDYVPFMKDKRTSYFWIKGEYSFGGKISFDAYLTTSDGANAVNILLDMIRALRIARDRKIGGVLVGASAYAFKNPPIKMRADEAERWFFEFVNRLKER